MPPCGICVHQPAKRRGPGFVARGRHGRVDGVAGGPPPHLRADQITRRPRWARLLPTWAATTCSALAGYLVCLAVLYADHPRARPAGAARCGGQAAVVAAAFSAFSALGFATGAPLPGRVTAPLAAIAAFFVLALGAELIVGSQWSGRSDHGRRPLGHADRTRACATFTPTFLSLAIAEVSVPPTDRGAARGPDPTTGLSRATPARAAAAAPRPAWRCPGPP